MYPVNNIKTKLLLSALCIIMLGSCRLLHLGKYHEGKSGCPTTNNIGAERILSGDPVALKAAKKNDKKFKQKKDYYN